MKTVLFDLFETLVSHFDPAWEPPLRSTAERLGVEQTFYDAHWGRFDKDWQAGTIEHYEQALGELCAAAGVQPDARVLAELRQEYIAYAARTAFVEPAPEIVEMLTALKSVGVKLGVVTNANNLDTAPWAQYELAPFFDVFVASHQVRLLKPEPKIYELACQRLRIEAGEAVFVGDGESNELWGASEAGLEAFWCTWFLDRWPEGIRPNGFPGDDWRQYPSQSESPYKRLYRPEDLLITILS
ncbi:HAD family hydrolase [Candidatus Entotheonella palauensis]|uniref:HAD family hydrolase n=1 Tax=Candidatus Entotheonella palauensis TaxID=93172 RepID=UPI000B7C9B54|nr:HAD family hydrolase [Candidatus Entotheonella palauensis]